MNKFKPAFPLLTLAICALIAGCTALGAVLSKTSAGKIPAKYKFPDHKILILAESYGNSGGIEVDAGRLEAGLIKAFRDNKIGTVFDADVIEKLRDSDPEHYSKMTIDGIGRAVGARQILYVHILRAQVDVPPGGGPIHGIMDARVHVVDSETGETLWPVDERDGLLMETITPWLENSGPNQEKTRLDMTGIMAQDISKLFYDWEPGSQTDYDELTHKD